MKQCSACNRQHDSAFQRCDVCREFGRKASKRWRDNHKDDERQRIQQWADENKDRLNEKVVCECGVEVQRRSLSKHRKSKTHQDTINAVDC